MTFFESSIEKLYNDLNLSERIFLVGTVRFDNKSEQLWARHLDPAAPRWADNPKRSYYERWEAELNCMYHDLLREYLATFKNEHAISQIQPVWDYMLVQRGLGDQLSYRIPPINELPPMEQIVLLATLRYEYERAYSAISRAEYVISGPSQVSSELEMCVPLIASFSSAISRLQATIVPAVASPTVAIEKVWQKIIEAKSKAPFRNWNEL